MERTLYTATAFYALTLEPYFSLSWFAADAMDTAAASHPDYRILPAEIFQNDDGSITVVVAGVKYEELEIYGQEK